MTARQRLRLSAAETAAIAEFTAGVRARLQTRLREMRLFGSRARGEGDADSDLDVAVIVEAGGRALRREVQDLAFDIGLRTGVDIAPLVIEEPQLQALRARERLLASELDRDGVAL